MALVELKLHDDQFQRNIDQHCHPVQPRRLLFDDRDGGHCRLEYGDDVELQQLWPIGQPDPNDLQRTGQQTGKVTTNDSYYAASQTINWSSVVSAPPESVRVPGRPFWPISTRTWGAVPGRPIPRR